MLCRKYLGRLLKVQAVQPAWTRLCSQVNIKKLEADQDTTEVTEDEAAREKEEELQRKRNKSRLKEADFRMLHEENPYPEATFWHHGTLKYLRRTYGRYGAASNVDPAICWPVKSELEDTMEYERVKYPETIMQMVQKVIAGNAEKVRSEKQRQEDIVKKIEKNEQWLRELHAKIAKKEGEAMEAKMRKERLVEEVRRHFGYTVDPRDDRFKELLEKKEKEQKKSQKEARRKAREEELLKKLMSKHATPPTE
uniref:Large ribosomal subunit protein mL64 n=1 Tax=Dendroctonus ponderosae TaxID=77166 RepID=J3JUV1_DENPD|nr:unknown [Dendroctonus ponderosae]